jgi:hypothetical protein
MAKKLVTLDDIAMKPHTIYDYDFVAVKINGQYKILKNKLSPIKGIVPLQDFCFYLSNSQNPLIVSRASLRNINEDEYVLEMQNADN